MKKLAVTAAALFLGLEGCSAAHQVKPNFQHSNQTAVVRHLAELLRQQYGAASPADRYLDHTHDMNVVGTLSGGVSYVAIMHASRLTAGGLPIPADVVSVEVAVTAPRGSTESVELAKGKSGTWSAYRRGPDGLLVEAIDQNVVKRQLTPGGSPQNISTRPAEVRSVWEDVRHDLSGIIEHHTLPPDLVPPPPPGNA